jgi:hypothetical protein
MALTELFLYLFMALRTYDYKMDNLRGTFEFDLDYIYCSSSSFLYFKTLLVDRASRKSITVTSVSTHPASEDLSHCSESFFIPAAKK